MSERLQNDVDPIETRDWLQAIESVIREEGVERAQYLIDQLLSEARKGGVKVASGAGASNYVNTIAVEDEPEYPGNLDLERRIRSAIRWNAIMTVLRASKKDRTGWPHGVLPVFCDHLRSVLQPLLPCS